jgi:chemotaxis receptor (MCP) glutamine deamidase CheD
MKTRNEAVIELAQKLAAMGYHIEKMEFKVPGGPDKFEYADIELKLIWNHPYQG